MVDTLDLNEFFRKGEASSQALDSALGGFSYSGDRGDEDAGSRVAGNPGYHVVNIVPAEQGTSKVAFRRYQQVDYNTVAFDSYDLPECERSEDREYPCVLTIRSTDAPATILLRQPEGLPQLATRKEDWEQELDTCIAQIQRYLSGPELQGARAWLSAYGVRARVPADLAALRRPLLPAADGGLARVPRTGSVCLCPAAQVMAGAVMVQPHSTVTSSLQSQAAVRAATAAAAATAGGAVKDGDFVMFRVRRTVSSGAGAPLSPAVEVDNWGARGSGGYPACLARVISQCTAGPLSSAPGQTCLEVAWWRLETNPLTGEGNWAGEKWVPWTTEGGRFWESSHPLAAVAYAPVDLWPSSSISGPVHAQWARVTRPGVRAVHLALGPVLWSFIS